MTEILQILFDGSELIGTVAFAASGAMLSIERNLDLFGVLFLGATTAVGGGIMRDVMLGTFPPNAFTHPIFVMLALVTSLIVFLFAAVKGAQYFQGHGRADRVINLLDAIGLGIFSVIGARTAMDQGYGDNAFLCIFMGMITGVGGGILRDLLSHAVPAVMRKRIYAVASIAGAGVYYLALLPGLPGSVAMIFGLLITVAIRLLAAHYEWNLPRIQSR